MPWVSKEKRKEYYQRWVAKRKAEGTWPQGKINTLWRARYKENPAAFKARNKKYRLAHPERAKRTGKDWQLRSEYGITLERYEQMEVAQNGVCAICSRKQPDRTNRPKRLSVDHDHKTGQVRALLCDCCNRALGLLDDDPARAKALTDYLLRYQKA